MNVSQGTEKDMFVSGDRSPVPFMSGSPSLRLSICISILFVLIAPPAGVLLLPGSGVNSEKDIQVGPGKGRAFDVTPVDLGLDLPADIPVRYVMLCPGEFADELLPLAVHRTGMGLMTEIYRLEDIDGNVSGPDLPGKVHNFLAALKKNQSSLQWLLIMGDSEFLMPRQLWHYAQTRGQPFGDYYYSDVYYSGLDSGWDLDGDGLYGEVYYNGTVEADLDWDLYVGRVPASNETQVSNYVNKLLRYEKNPPVGTWMRRFLNWGSLMEPPNLETSVHRYIDYKSNAYKVCKRVDGNLPPHLDVRELYDYPQIEGGNYTPYDGRDTLDRSHMLSQFNGGASMLNFVGQARYEAYALNDYGPPTGNGSNWAWNEPMRYSDHSVFRNGDMMPFMYASTCDTAKFFQTGYWEDKSLETWLTSPAGGIIGLISSTNISARGEQEDKSWGNWYLDEEFWKLFLNSNETHPGRTLYILKNAYRDRWYNPSMTIKETIMGLVYAYILLGEPFIDVYTDTAGRFDAGLGSAVRVYQGNHPVRFRVADRDGNGIPYARVTFHSHSVYATLVSDGEGWIDGFLDPGGDDILNMTVTAHNMVMYESAVNVLPEIADIQIMNGSVTVDPEHPDQEDDVNISFIIFNSGGLAAENVNVRTEVSDDDGGNWSLLRNTDIGTIIPSFTARVNINFRPGPGRTLIRFSLSTTSDEIDVSNNELELLFDVAGPAFHFEQGTGLLRPSSIVRPSSTISVDYDVFNQGPSWGDLVLQLFLGDPEEGGTPLTAPFDAGRVQPMTWANGSLEALAPDATGLIYIVMDPGGIYPRFMIDSPVKSLIEINEAPRVIERPSVVILEDGEGRNVRIDTLFSDDDNISSDLEYRIEPVEGLNTEMKIGPPGEVWVNITPERDWWGNASIPVTVSDGLGTNLTFIDVSVIPVNDPPVVENAVHSRIDLTILEDSPFSAIIRAYDKEGGAVIFSAGDAPFTLDSSTGLLSWTPSQKDVGYSEWTITVSDTEGASTSIIIAIEVIQRNDPPVVEGVVNITLDPGSRRTIEIWLTDEEGDEMTVLFDRPFVLIEENGGKVESGTLEITFVWNSAYIGENPVTMEVSDGVNTVSVPFMVTMHEGSTGSGDNESGPDSDALMAVIGVVLGIMAALFISFLLMRRAAVSRKVREELAAADELYENDMRSLEE
ncbi:MAG TPA: hypothetical protein ENK47_08420 [Euryarchaeota archaeon]|nr:MAG: hypothetical protein B6U90_04175 [Thermoplasmatales archaeon ex4484_6]HHD16718.1 hypothetical protein [Euryarchaeota archaeon]